ncbi:poly(3-hydroxybutyrate) depolymerase [Loktanella ponticola]|uniref:Poly(3-hydroxybutyrate) depolymerase n=1 Tax=Yoonia ponticola TaxID=1524255 RepID=A0A7W9EWS1_9RHOB|nr:poly(3-hydroxybutyrate) depolymerase [Yoonia ponticola]
MKYMMTYDLMEATRNTNQWLGATARAFADYPMMSLTTNPGMDWLRAWGEVTERTFGRMVVKPDWNIPPVPSGDGRDHSVDTEIVLKRDFGDLIQIKVQGRDPMPRRVLLVAPMSGHYATLLRKTVISLLPDCDVYITDWHNARDIPVSAGKFDVEDYTLYLVEFMKELGADIHVIAVCQPVPLALAATAYLAEEDPKAQPRSLTLIGGPVDPEANHTEVTDFGRSVTMGQLEQTMIQRVGFKYAGVGRTVYPGLLQLASFISMNGETHADAFRDQIIRSAKGEAREHDKHNVFYDEYLAVMDMTSEFYLSTVERIFKGRDIARNDFVVAGKKVDIGKINNVAVKIVEGEKDDISAPGQCLAALDLLTGLDDGKKASHLEPGAGHYGIFAGGSWRNNIRPLVLDFIDANSGAPAPAAAKKATPAAAPAKAELKIVSSSEPKKSEAPKAEAAPAKPAAVKAKPAAKPAKTAAPKAKAAPAAAKADVKAVPTAVKAEAPTAPKAEAAPVAAAPKVEAAPAPAVAKVEAAATPVAPKAEPVKAKIAQPKSRAARKAANAKK